MNEPQFTTDIEVLKKQIAFQKAGIESGFDPTPLQALWLEGAEKILAMSTTLREIVWQSNSEDECNEIASECMMKLNIPFK